MRKLLLMLAMLAGGCAVGPDYTPPVASYSDQWHSDTGMDGSAQAAGRQWWQQFNDPLLVSLIDETMHNNRDLAVALAHIERARGLRREAGSGYFPTLNAGGSANRTRFSRQTGFGANTGTRSTFSAALDASWEPDLFGRTRRAIEAADARLQASLAAQQGLMLSLTAEVAVNYFELRGLQRQLVMTERDITLLKEMEEIARAKTELGVASDMDISQAQGERENIAATLPALHAGIQARIFRISVLTGKAPEFYNTILLQAQPLPVVTDRVPTGLRSEILKRRPDIRQAERELAAATADIGVAKAEMFPVFSLTGSTGSSARLFTDLFTPATLTRSLGAALGWPVFAGGAITARVDIAKADARAALASYEQSVLLALEDAEGALARYAGEWQTLRQLKAAEASRLQAFTIARLRYEAGEEPFLVMLDAERALITTRDAIVGSETRVLTTLAQLHKALGGDWQPADSNSASAPH
ncbi:efflux transporter outer membrane subunit [Mariprofundus erugo]|uniref:efflux transporter outer membrane subunit n=1 Tax=Mariprofundus erugo TaxID=2528639 RepID=UPI0010FD1F91|nr:efflux transporter outer membrane subunit [Mariprofundus erugo]TLS77628.1 efflux transporter outer membrane subunit [Mariprofundus erugo]